MIIMKRLCAIIIISCGILSLSTSFAIAQDEPGEFKFIPPYYPDGEPANIHIPSPQLVHIPIIVYPDDPALQGKDTRVLVKILVDRKGNVTDAKILKSQYEAFNKYAILYAKQYKFRWIVNRSKPLREIKGVWCSISINFNKNI